MSVLTSFNFAVVPSVFGLVCAAILLCSRLFFGRDEIGVWGIAWLVELSVRLRASCVDVECGRGLGGR